MPDSKRQKLDVQGLFFSIMHDINKHTHTHTHTGALDFQLFFLTVIGYLTFPEQSTVMQVCRGFRRGFRHMQTMLNVVVCIPRACRAFFHDSCGIVSADPIPFSRMLEFKNLTFFGRDLPREIGSDLPCGCCNSSPAKSIFGNLTTLRLFSILPLENIIRLVKDFNAPNLCTLMFEPDVDVSSGVADIKRLMDVLATFPRLTNVTVWHPTTYKNYWVSLILECKYNVTVKRGYAPDNQQPWFIFLDPRWQPAPPEHVFQISSNLKAKFALVSESDAAVTLELAGFPVPFTVPLDGSLVRYGSVFIIQARTIPLLPPRYTLSPYPHGNGMECPDSPETQLAIIKRFENNAAVLKLKADLT